MSLRFDDKGKFFTEIVSKETIQVIIQTPTNHISGQMHIRPDERLRDAVNQAESFLAITEATIYDLNQKELYRCNFLALNRDHIIWILPYDQVVEEKRGDA